MNREDVKRELVRRAVEDCSTVAQFPAHLAVPEKPTEADLQRAVDELVAAIESELGRAMTYDERADLFVDLVIRAKAESN